MEPGQQITVRGPYGNGFPVDTAFAGKDLLFIAGASVWPRCIPLSTTAVTTVTATARSTSSTAPAQRTIW